MVLHNNKRMGLHNMFEKGNELVQTCYNGQVDKVVQTIKEVKEEPRRDRLCENIDMTCSLEEGETNTPLNFAVLRCGKELEQKMVSLILNRKLNSDLSQKMIHKVYGDRFYGGIKIVQILLESGADVNRTDASFYRYGLPPILNAALCGHVEVVQLLLAKNADINRRIEYNLPNYIPFHPIYPPMTPLIYAIKHKNTNAVQILLDANADVNKTYEKTGHLPTPPILHAALCGHTEAVHLLLANNADINCRMEVYKLSYGRNLHEDRIQHEPSITPLIYAIEHKNTNAIQILLDANADIQMHTTYNSTTIRSIYKPPAKNSPLHIAACVGDSGIVETLLRHNAIVDDLNEDGDTPLLVATSKCHCDIVETLLKHNARRDVQNCYRQSPLQVAITNGKLQVVERLLDINIKGPDYISMFALDTMNNDCNSTFEDVLENALYQMNNRRVNSLSIIVAILRSYPDVYRYKINKIDNTENKYGIPPILQAALCGHMQVVQLLIAKNADINCRIEYNSYRPVIQYPTITPLIYAIKYNLSAVQIILDANADIQKTYHAKQSPLHIAARFGDSGIVETLLRHNASIDDLDNLGQSPLHAAINFQTNDAAMSIIKILLINNARRDIQDCEGTPLHLAITNVRFQLVDLLLNFNIKGPGYNSMFEIRNETTGLDILETAIDTLNNYKELSNYISESCTSILVATFRSYPDFYLHSEKLDLLIFKYKHDSDIVRLMLMRDDRVDKNDLSPIIQQNVVNLLYEMQWACSKEEVKKLINNYKANNYDITEQETIRRMNIQIKNLWATESECSESEEISEPLTDSESECSESEEIWEPLTDSETD